MNIRLTIKTGNAAFDDPDDRTAEVARILTDYANRLVDTGSVILPGDEWTLRDINGNEVGQVKVTR